jgi:glycosyltransferase involved in cell wall biosynthesis
MPLHIAIDGRRVRGFGIGTYIRNITRALSHVDSANRYTIVAHREDFDLLSGLGPNFTLLAFNKEDSGFQHNFITTPRFFRSLKADLYHIPLNSVAWWMPTPYVLTIHDMSTLLFPSAKNIRSLLHEERFRRGALRAAHIVAVSEATHRDILDVLRIPPDRITTIYSAPDPAFARNDMDPAQRRAILERYSITYPYVLYAGTIRPRKNIPRLIEAFAILRHDIEEHPTYKDLHLVIIGDELSRNPAVRRAVVQSRIEPFVRFLGFLPIETLKVFYGAARLFAFPSLYEGFGLAPLEAMACGTPVVASNVPSLLEAVGDAAELVTPDNPFDIARGMRNVLLDDSCRERLIAAGRLRAARVQWESTANELLDIYLRSSRNCQ